MRFCGQIHIKLWGFEPAERYHANTIVWRILPRYGRGRIWFDLKDCRITAMRTFPPSGYGDCSFTTIPLGWIGLKGIYCIIGEDRDS